MTSLPSIFKPTPRISAYQSRGRTGVVPAERAKETVTVEPGTSGVAVSCVQKAESGPISRTASARRPVGAFAGSETSIEIRAQPASEVGASRPT
ncbi:MAG: hypothetical protein QM765_41145 [Myxococcales bacterium]